MNKVRSPLARLWQIRRVIKKYGLASLLNELSLSRSASVATRALFGASAETSESRGVRIRLALEELGPVFVKLGQTLSTRPDLLPEDIAVELTKLQDQVPAFAAEESMRIIQNAYGVDFDTIFESVEHEPLASASVAQVHTATLNDGLSIERGQQFRPLDVIQEYDHTIHGELDLRIEAANGARMGANFEDSDLIYVPRIYWDYTKRNVLVMERIYGTSIRDFDTLKKNGYSMKSLGEDGVQTFSALWER